MKESAKRLKNKENRSRESSLNQIELVDPMKGLGINSNRSSDAHSEKGKKEITNLGFTLG